MGTFVRSESMGSGNKKEHAQKNHWIQKLRVCIQADVCTR